MAIKVILQLQNQMVKVKITSNGINQYHTSLNRRKRGTYHITSAMFQSKSIVWV